jgi:hypothetical protein
MLASGVFQFVVATTSGWERWKHSIERLLWYQSDSLHVACGVLIVVLVALALRKNLASFAPWSVLLLLSSSNEAIDIFYTQKLAESVKDTLLTMLVPTILLVTVRAFPELYRSGAPPPVSTTFIPD